MNSLRFPNSPEWLTELRHVLYLQGWFYGSKRIQTRTSQRERRVGWVLGGSQTSFLHGVLSGAASSWLCSVEILTVLPTTELIGSVVCRVFIGVSLHRLKWIIGKMTELHLQLSCLLGRSIAWLRAPTLSSHGWSFWLATPHTEFIFLVQTISWGGPHELPHRHELSGVIWGPALRNKQTLLLLMGLEFPSQEGGTKAKLFLYLLNSEDSSLKWGD